MPGQQVIDSGEGEQYGALPGEQAQRVEVDVALQGSPVKARTAAVSHIEGKPADHLPACHPRTGGEGTGDRFVGRTQPAGVAHDHNRTAGDEPAEGYLPGTGRENLLPRFGGQINPAMPA